jgi:hypothetical protein
LLVGALHGTIPQDSPIVIEAYPLGLLVEPIANRDVKVGDLPMVEGEAFWWLVESPLIVELTLLKAVESILIGFGGNSGVSLVIGDGL